MEKLRITIETLSPVVLTASGSSQVLTESKPYFSGSIIRGILAARYIQMQELGNDAHENKDFRTLFFRDIRFVPAYISRDGQRAIPLPVSILKKKEDGSLRDTCRDFFAAGFKRLKGYGIVSDDGIVTPLAAKHNISFHMSRSTDTERLGGHSQLGKVYNYESLDRGQTFIGELLGPKEALQALWDGLALPYGSFTTQVGRSKYTQYGQCRVTVTADTTPAVQKVPEEIFLRLDTPVLSLQQGIITRAETVLQEVVDRLNHDTQSQAFSLEGIPKNKAQKQTEAKANIAASIEEIDNFVGIWHMRRPRQQGLEAGSVFQVFKKDPWTTDDVVILQDICYDGIGDRKAEGFGQLRLWNHTNLVLANNIDTVHGTASPDTREIQSDEVKRVIRNIFLNRLREQLRLQAAQDAEHAKMTIQSNMTHALARLESELGDRTNIKGIRSHVKGFVTGLGTAMTLRDHLQNIKINGSSLYDLFSEESGKKAMPYEPFRFNRGIAKELAEKVGLSETTLDDDFLFYEYWLWFFRHGRKEAVKKGGNTDEK